MALAKIKKIQLIGSKSEKPKILEILQETGCVDIMEIDEKITEENADQDETERDGLEKIELAHANAEFAVKLLSNYGKKRGLLEGPEVMSSKEAEERVNAFDYEKIVKSCEKTEDKAGKTKTAIASLQNELNILQPWESLEIEIQDIGETERTKAIIGSVKTNFIDEAKEIILRLSKFISFKIVKRLAVDTYILIILDKELEKELRQILTEYKFTELELPKVEGLVSDRIKEIKKTVETEEKNLKETEKELQKLGKHLGDMQVTLDYLGWQLEKAEASKKLGQTEYSFVITGWIPAKKLNKLKEQLEEKTKEYEIIEIPLKEGEIPPVELTNSNFLSPFEAVSKIYGLPKADELDPTPFLALYFILFFALCLTDAGYGLVMFLVMFTALKFMKLAEGIRKLVKLLMYGGIVTFVIGAIFGGWFGLTPDQVPAFLTYTAANGEKMFLLQKINAISNPIAVLILSLALGYVQITMGVIIKFVHEFRNSGKLDATLDHGTWVVMLMGIGFFILTMTGVLPSSLSPIGKYWVMGAAVLLVLTQGRSKKNIFAKLISGILSLYGLVGYMSDVLSYSRILALGLATAIIGLAVNTIVGLAGGIPYVGWLLMAVIFIGGHIFNLVINALGSFIHSGRLQFVEFFTKFMEGGGDELKPFSKKTKHIFLKK